VSRSDSTHRRETPEGGQRPEIPAAISREVFVEAGHRCAVCGTPFPLERAHIIPWRRSRDHSVENLICLCANCHERADKDWDEETLREYKRRPWNLRQHSPNEFAESSPRRETLVITIQLQLRDFDDKRKLWLQHALASFLDTHPESVEIRSVHEGSVKVFVRLDAEAAARLLEAHATGDPELRKHLGDLVVTDIKSSTKELIANRAYELWRALGCPEGRDLELWLQAETEIVHSDVSEGDRLIRFVSSCSDLQSALDDVRKTLAQTKFQGARLSDFLVQRVLAATRDALRRFTGDRLEVDLFGIDSGEIRWVSVALPPTDFQPVGKLFFSELEDALLTGRRTVAFTEDLVNRGVLPAEAVRTLREEGIHAVAVWPVHAVDDQQTERPALVLLALASDSAAFADSLTNLILEHSASFLGLVIEIGLRDDLRTRDSKLVQHP